MAGRLKRAVFILALLTHAADLPTRSAICRMGRPLLLRLGYVGLRRSIVAYSDRHRSSSNISLWALIELRTTAVGRL